MSSPHPPQPPEKAPTCFSLSLGHRVPWEYVMYSAWAVIDASCAACAREVCPLASPVWFPPPPALCGAQRRYQLLLWGTAQCDSCVIPFAAAPLLCLPRRGFLRMSL